MVGTKSYELLKKILGAIEPSFLESWELESPKGILCRGFQPSYYLVELTQTYMLKN